MEKTVAVRPRARGGKYWTELSKRVQARPFTEEVLKSAERYRRDKLIRAQEECGRGEAPTIIPFPTEEAPAAARPDPQETHDTQGDAGRASAAQRIWVSRARRKTAKKSRRKRDWGRFTFRDRFTPQERLEREKANYRRGKLLSGQNTQLPDPAATIIPFPSVLAQAADGSIDPSGDT